MPEERLQIQYDLAREEHAAAMRYVTRQLVSRSSRGWLPVMLCVVGAVCGGVIAYAYLELAGGYRGPSPQWAAWGAVAFLVACLATIWHQQYRVRKIHAVSVADDGAILGPQEFTVTQEALVHRHRNAMTNLAWRALKSIEERDGNVLIFTDNAAFYVVPGKAFADSSERAAWVGLLRARARPDAAGEQDAPRAETPSVQPSAPVARAAGLEWGLLRNLRAGIKLVVLQRVERGDLIATAEGFVAQVVLTAVVSFLIGVASVGLPGQFNYYELPRALLFVPLTLLFGLVIARLNKDPEAVLVLAVALTAAGTVVTIVIGALVLVAQHQILEVSAKHWRFVHYVSSAWWAAIIMAAVLRLAPPDVRLRFGAFVVALFLLVLPAWMIPQGYLWTPRFDPNADGTGRTYWAIAEEKAFYAQHDALPRALAAIQPERPGIADLYVITAGLYAREDVFMKEVRVIDKLFRERFDADGRTLMLINNPKTLEQNPVATLTSLTTALRHVGKLMNPDEDVLVLYVSSHGSQQHHLAVEFWPLRLNSIDPAALKAAVGQSGVKWKVLVVSACYSGGFVEPLKDDHTLIITASSATKGSFGCGNESDSTYLAKALFDEELRKTYSFEAAFAEARKSIEQRELGQGYTPSEPQIFVGAAIRDKLTQVEQRLAARQIQSTEK
jgi:hypothetical protein